MRETQQTELHHVPGCAVVIAHKVQRHGDVGVAVITAQVVL